MTITFYIPPLMTRADVAALEQASIETVRRWIRVGLNGRKLEATHTGRITRAAYCEFTGQLYAGPLHAPSPRRESDTTRRARKIGLVS